jgi:hypothetical protein
LTGEANLFKVLWYSGGLMGSDTKKTNTRRRMKATKRAANRAKEANRALVRLKAKGFNKPLTA